MSEKKDKTYGVKMPLEKKEYYQQLPGQYGMTSEQFLDAMFESFCRSQDRKALAELDPVFRRMVEFFDEIDCQAPYIVKEHARLKQQQDFEMQLLKDQLNKAWAEKAHDSELWAAEVQMIKDQADKTMAEAEQEKKKAAEARQEAELVRQRADDDRRQSHEILSHQKNIIDQLRHSEALLRGELQAVRERLETLSAVEAERDKLIRELEELKVSSQRAIEKAVIDVRQQYLDKREAAIDRTIDKPSSPTKPEEGDIPSTAKAAKNVKNPS